MGIVHGQREHFDNKEVSFDLIGTEYNYLSSYPGIIGHNISIQYGNSIGNKRMKGCLRRYIYQYDSINNLFVYQKTCKGVRNFSIQTTQDLEELNLQSEEHATELFGEIEPEFITQEILSSLFLSPGHNNIFFIEGLHSLRKFGSGSSGTFSAPKFFKIYRFGKIINGEIVLVKNNSSMKA